jgi:hypothetical protein
MRGVPTGQYMAQRKPGRLRGHFLRIGSLERSTAQFMSQNCYSIVAIGMAAGLGGWTGCQTGPELRKGGQKVFAAGRPSVELLGAGMTAIASAVALNGPGQLRAAVTTLAAFLALYFQVL